MRATEFITESAVSELVKELPSLAKHDYDAIDKLMRKIAQKHKITGKALHNLFQLTSASVLCTVVIPLIGGQEGRPDI